jgi:hypothetical protein
MTRSLVDQLAEYGKQHDSGQQPVDFTEVVPELEIIPVEPATENDQGEVLDMNAKHWGMWLTAAAVAVLALVVGGVVMASGDDSGTDETATEPTQTESSTTEGSATEPAPAESATLTADEELEIRLACREQMDVIYGVLGTPDYDVALEESLDICVTYALWRGSAIGIGLTPIPRVLEPACASYPQTAVCLDAPEDIAGPGFVETETPSS